MKDKLLQTPSTKYKSLGLPEIGLTITGAGISDQKIKKSLMQKQDQLRDRVYGKLTPSIGCSFCRYS
jgi:hypothetical protein